jgi:ribosomal protein L17
LVPRNLIFVRILEENGDIVKIAPDLNIISKKDFNWDFHAYENAFIEKRYIFKAIKSTNMVPFGLISDELVFLPIEKQGSIFHTKITGKYGKEHFKQISKIYQEKQKDNARILTLEARLNYGSALTRADQYSRLKIIYAGIGTTVKAVILRDSYIIDTSVYYYIPDTENEAYYLSAYLNSTIITENVRLIGSTGQSGSLRNIHKTPLKFGLPKFDDNNIFHLNLVHLGKEAENLVQKLIKTANQNSITKRLSVQNQILSNPDYLMILKDINLNIEKLT